MEFDLFLKFNGVVDYRIDRLGDSHLLRLVEEELRQEPHCVVLGHESGAVCELGAGLSVLG